MLQHKIGIVPVGLFIFHLLTASSFILFPLLSEKRPFTTHDSILDNLELSAIEGSVRSKKSGFYAATSSITVAEFDSDAAAVAVNDLINSTHVDIPYEVFDQFIETGMRLVIKHEVENTPKPDPADFEALMKYHMEKQPFDEFGGKRRHLVDIGSGVGRIPLYAGLTACNHGRGWNIYGIERSLDLHTNALFAIEKGIKSGLLYNLTGQPENIEDTFLDGAATKISFMLGSLENHTIPLARASIVLIRFSDSLICEDVDDRYGMPLLNSEVCSLLSSTCQDGCVFISLDSVPNYNYGFEPIKAITASASAKFGLISVLTKTSPVDEEKKARQ